MSRASASAPSGSSRRPACAAQPRQDVLQLARRAERAAKLFELDDAVTIAVDALKARGLKSPYLRAFVVARINPIRFQRGAVPPYEQTIDRMLAAAKAFDPEKVRVDDVARTGGPPPEE